MNRRILLATLSAMALCLTVQAAPAFPIIGTPQASQATLQKVTFWARSFPYRYNWSLVRACTHYETVETPRGPVVRRVWVCDLPARRSRAVVSYRN